MNIPTDPTPSRPLAGLLVALLGIGLLSGCATKPRKASTRPIPSNCSLVLPSGEMRMVQVMAGLPESGAEFGPFSGRNDSRMGASGQPFERVVDGYERRVFDRQFTSVGRPYNIYQDTTYAIKRISR